jgi:hypothetical protein
LKIIGLDISKKSCGVAIGDGTGPPRTAQVSFDARSDDGAWAAYEKWLRERLVSERPGLVAAERAWSHTDKKSSTRTRDLLLGFGIITRTICFQYGVRCRTVSTQTWRKDFIANGRPADPKGEALTWCRLLGWPTGGNHDRAEACGVWCWAHIRHGDTRAMQRQLSASSLRVFERV